jgi:hypothetical protein
MGRDNSGKAKVVITDNLKETGNLKGMYYFLIGVSAVIPVLFMLKLLYIDVINIDGAVATHTQYYLWSSPWLIGKIFRETADGRFFTLATLIPLGMVLFGLINCVASIMKAFTENISWKHAEACNRACTNTIVAVLAMLLIFNITGPFFDIKSGFSGQDLTFNVVIYIILGVAIIGKIVAHYYFKEVRSRQLF